METSQKNKITVSTLVNAPVEKVWESWTDPKQIIQWNSASPDWHTPKAENDLKEGGRFSSRMEAKDGSMGFDFGGVYVKIEPHRHISYTLDDERKVAIDFAEENGQTKIDQTFEAEEENTLELQQQGWQAIMNNFKKHVEADV